ncbi:MAG TPA: PH domain-containing protein [Asanoa sp.]|nr:PH domain-containing protein [Asanoa sp.]
MTWLRLDRKVVAVDLVRAGVSLVPTAVAAGVLGLEPGDAWPALAVALIGVTRAVADLIRWATTRYRITDERVEVRGGLFVRGERWIARDRIRSVSSDARLSHRLFGLRVVTVGAGLTGVAGSTAALRIDAVSVETARRLHAMLDGTDASDPTPQAATAGQVLARFQPSWVFYNVLSVWAVFAGAALLWGGYWLGKLFGYNAFDHARRLADGVAPLWIVLVAVLAFTIVGSAGLVVGFVSAHWNFRLTRVAGNLRTTQGLLRTHTVDREEHRVRGIQIREPQVWRWLGVAETTVITTGVSLWSATGGATILPRGPVSVARATAAEILGSDVMSRPLRPAPPAALRRRLVRGTVQAVVATVGWLLLDARLDGPLAAADAIWLFPALLAVTTAGAVLAYRSLGHAVHDGYLVVRAGPLTRATAALRLSAVIGWRVRQSFFQRRLGLATVTAATAAGQGAYTAHDVAASDVHDLLALHPYTHHPSARVLPIGVQSKEPGESGRSGHPNAEDPERPALSEPHAATTVDPRPVRW